MRASPDNLVDVPAALADAFGARTDDIIFLSGSRTEGFGNARSDYDLYVIHADDAGGLPYVTVVLEHAYAVYETFSRSHVEQVAQSVNRLDAADIEAMARVSWYDLELYYRLLVGQPLRNADAFRVLRQPLRKPRIDSCIAAWTGIRAVAALDQARLRIELGRKRSAFMAARSACWSMVDSYLATQGESYPGFKWRFEKIARCRGAHSDLWRRAWELKNLGEVSVEAYLERVAAFCADLGMGTYRRWSLGRTTYRHAPATSLVQYGGRRYVVENHSAMYELSDAATTIWTLAGQGVEHDDIVARTGAAHDMPALNVNAAVMDFIDAGVIV